jgi:diaminopimelate epimerase
MKLPFVKMHGLGNDFVVLDGVRQSVALTPPQLRRLADRHFGIGCDQILLVEPASQPGSIFAIGSSMPMAARSNSVATAHAASFVSFTSRA